MPIINSNLHVYEQETNRLKFLATPRDKKLLYYATSAGVEAWRSDFVIERENINIYMINYIVGGRARLTVEGVQTELSAGDLTFLHLTNCSRLEAMDEKTRIIYFHVSGGQIKEIYDTYLSKGDYVLHGFPLKTINDYYARFEKSVNAGEDFYEQSRILYCLLTEILQLRENEAKNKYPKFIDKIMCYIFYFCPVPSPRETAEHFGFNQIYLERLFKRYVGESLSSFISKQKYTYACRFLTDTDMSVQEIARKIGYANSQGLIALFSKFGEETPLAYRKKMRKRFVSSPPRIGMYDVAAGVFSDEI